MKCEDCIYYESERDTGSWICTNNNGDTDDPENCFREKMTRAEFKAAEEW
jgi:hypothetical protein